jgi:hypothetical protein
MKTFRLLVQCLTVFNCCHASVSKEEESTATATASTVESVSCAGESLSNIYLSGLMRSSTTGLMKPPISNFIPSVYYDGGSAKFVTTKEGMTTLDHGWLCVNGSNNSGPIQLYDDGTNGDDVSLVMGSIRGEHHLHYCDNLYFQNLFFLLAYLLLILRNPINSDCVHYCSSNVNFDDMFGFAMAQDISGQKFIVMDPSKEGTVPSQEIYEVDIPLTRDAKVFASSHAFFFADVNKKYFPNFPNDDGSISLSPNAAGDPSGKSAATAALMQVFGDVFDYVTTTPLEGEINGGIYKWQNWDRRGGPQPDAEIGEADICLTALTGVPIHRLVGGITMPHLAEGTELRAEIHELVHGIAGYEFNNNFEAARTGDGMHLPGSCTMDHSSLQGSIWDWVLGAPNSIARLDGVEGGLRLEANSECDDCPDNDLANCCSFRYLNSPFTTAEFLANPELATMSPLMQYISGFIKMKDVPKDKRTYYCMGSDTDGGCGEEDIHEKKCVLTVDDSDRSKVTSEFVTRATFQELVDSNGGARFPQRKFDVIRHANVIISSRIPTEAEITFHTIFWRQMEIMAEPWERISNVEGLQQSPMLSWRFETGGKSVLHSRLHGIDCGESSSSVPSCGNGNGGVCDGAPCGPGAVCKIFDGQPLCMCKEGLIGDGYECVLPSETAAYERLPSAQELASDNAIAIACFPVNNVWPREDFVTLPPYPGGQSPYAPTSCLGEVCGVGWRCNKKRGCLPPTSKSICEGKVC